MALLIERSVFPSPVHPEPVIRMHANVFLQNRCVACRQFDNIPFRSGLESRPINFFKQCFVTAVGLPDQQDKHQGGAPLFKLNAAAPRCVAEGLPKKLTNVDSFGPLLIS